ncbi:MAG: thiamine phosphate synthase, partial [Planctomycetaceae bacterium]|nr:thiamine phosphate synthase [Planctomycetaceae bacterium]
MDNNEVIGVLRIIDANANRAAEALRTIEEYARFVVSDANMSQAIKSLRHRLASI